MDKNATKIDSKNNKTNMLSIKIDCTASGYKI